MSLFQFRYETGAGLRSVTRSESIVAVPMSKDVYLKAYETVSQAPTGISRCIDFYNSRRPHSAHGGRTPDVVYLDSLPQTKAAA